MSDYIAGGGEEDMSILDSVGETLLYKAAEDGDVKKCEKLLLSRYRDC